MTRRLPWCFTWLLLAGNSWPAVGGQSLPTGARGVDGQPAIDQGGGYGLDRQVGIGRWGAALTALFSIEPMLKRPVTEPEGEASARAEGGVILAPVAGAVRGLFLAHTLKIPRPLPPRLFLQQSRITMQSDFSFTPTAVSDSIAEMKVRLGTPSD